MSTTPKKYSTVCPYLMVKDVEKQLHFLEEVFGGDVKERKTNEKDQLQHAEIALGEVVIMMGRARAEWPERKSMNYVFVEDVDAVFATAMKKEAIALTTPEKRDYGLYEAGFEDDFGNQWWIGSPI